MYITTRTNGTIGNCKKEFKKAKRGGILEDVISCVVGALYSVPSLFTPWIAPYLEQERLANSSLYPLLS